MRLLCNHLSHSSSQLITSFYELPVVKIPSSLPKRQSRSLSIEEPLSLSAALSISMGTGDELMGAIDAFTGTQNQVNSGQQTEDDVFESAELPDTLPIDIRAKLLVCMIHLKYPFPEVDWIYMIRF